MKLHWQALCLCVLATSVAHADLAYTFSGGGYDQVRVATSEGTDGGALISTTTGTSPFGIQQHTGTGQLYWLDISTNSVYRSDADGSNETAVFSTLFAGDSNSSPLSLTINEENGRIYWGDSLNDAIRSAGLDGSNPTVHVSSSGIAGSPNGLRFDLEHNRVLWGDGTSDAIYSLNLLDNTTTQLIDLAGQLGDGAYATKGIVIVDDQMYFIDSSSDALYSSDLDGSNAAELFDLAAFYEANGNFGDSSSAATPNALEYEDGVLYWTEGNSGKRGIYGFDLLTETGFQLLDTEAIDASLSPIGLSTYSAAAVPEPTHIGILSVALFVFGTYSYRRRKQLVHAS